jgi:hypothetical protein
MNVSCWIYPAVVCISPSIGTSQADPKLPLQAGPPPEPMFDTGCAEMSLPAGCGTVFHDPDAELAEFSRSAVAVLIAA